MVSRIWRRLRSARGLVKPNGWTVLGFGLLAALAASVTNWRELGVVAAGSLLLLALALPFLMGRTRVAVDVKVEPLRVVAGESVAADIRVSNVASSRLLPTVLDLPVGQTLQRYGIPTLGPGEFHEEQLTLRTERRGVIALGPATTRRGDPLSLFSRDVEWTEVVEVLVRPPMVPLESLGAGLLRDLEGVPIDAVSQSDLAFHALREYVPGDDLRHVHWRSSAKAMGVGGRTQLLVRQYLDTRRSHATVVVDDDESSWADPEDFETAMSVAASLAVRALLDEFETSFMCGDQAASGTSGNDALDAICRAGFGSSGLVTSAQRAVLIAPDTSLLFLVTGSMLGFARLAHAAAAFAAEVRRIALIVDPSTPSRVVEVDGIPVLNLAAKSDLGALLRWSVR